MLVEFNKKEIPYTSSGPLEKKIIRDFIDLLILKHLQKYPFVSGYEILNYLRQKFDIPFSPGTVYSMIYSLERHGLIKGDGNDIGRTYKLTNEGKNSIDEAVKAQDRIQRIIADVLLGE
jgi:DNA-binding PadR family transcriptional regulator